jgi:Cytochrome oxidase complex assembly protein 1
MISSGLGARGKAAARSEQGGPRWTRLGRRLVAPAVFFVLMLTAFHFIETSSGAYKLAVATANKTPQLIEALGPPIAEDTFSEGTLLWGTPATAEMSIPVHGQRQSGQLHVQAIKDHPEWRLTELTLELSRPYKRIDLLADTGQHESDAAHP